MAMLGAPVLVLSKLCMSYETIMNYVKFVLDSNTKRETGRKAQLGNIQAAKVLSNNLLSYLFSKCCCIAVGYC